MKLKTKYDSMSDVPAGYEDLYTEQDGATVLTGVEGIKTQADIDRLSEGLRKERNDHTALREKFKAISNTGLEPEEIIDRLDKYDELEARAGGEGDEEKIEKIVASRIAQKTKPLERDLNSLKEENEKLKLENQNLSSTIDKRDRSSVVNKIALDSNVHKTAIDDIELASATMFEKDDNGNWITKDGIPGITPGLDPKGWIKEMQNLRPHWWPENESGGAKDLKNGLGGGNNPFSKEHWNLTEQGRIYKEDPELAAKLEKAAVK